MHKLVLTFLIAIGGAQLWAQVPAWQWVTAPKNTYEVESIAIVTDKSNNVVVTGNFKDTLQFGSIILNGMGNQLAPFIAKYSLSGSLLWATQVGGKVRGSSGGIVTDAQGNVFFYGMLSDTARFGNYDLSPLGGPFVLVKYNSNGQFSWAKRFGGNVKSFFAGLGRYGGGKSLTIDVSGNLYFTASGQTDSIHNLVIDTFQLSSHLPLVQTAIVKVDSNGMVKWVKNAPMAHSIGIDTIGNVYITGLLTESPIQLDNITVTPVTSLYSNQTTYLAKYNSTGSVSWAKVIGCPNSQYPGVESRTIVIDNEGNPIIGGDAASKSFIIDGINYSLPTIGPFAAKFSPAGTLSWIRGASSTTAGCEGFSLAVDKQNSIYLQGAFYNTVAFGFDTLRNSSQTTNDIFIVKLDKNGNYKWALRGGGTEYDEGNSLAVDDAGYLYVLGHTNSQPCSFGALSVSTNGGQAFDAFLAKLSSSTSIEDQPTRDQKLTLFPNPANDHISVTFPENFTGQFRIADAIGRLVYDKKVAPGTKSIEVDICGLSSGVYTAEAEGNGHAVCQFVIEK